MNIYNKLNDAFLEEDEEKTLLTAVSLSAERISLNENYSPEHLTSFITLDFFNKTIKNINSDLPDIEEVLKNEQ